MFGNVFYYIQICQITFCFKMFLNLNVQIKVLLLSFFILSLFYVLPVSVLYIDFVSFVSCNSV